MGAVLSSILPLRLVVAAVIHVVWRQLSALSSSLVVHIPPMRVALPWRRHRDPTADLLHWNVRIQLMHDPCPLYHHRWMSPTASPSCLFCVSDSNEACMHGMVEVTLVRCGEESMEDPSSEVVVWQRGRVSFIPSELSIRQNVRGYSFPTRWSDMQHEYGAYSSPFCLPAVGSTVVMESPIDWGSVEALPTPSERCESAAASPHDRQVARVIPQRPTPRPGRHALKRGMPLLSQLLQQEPGPPGPPPPSSLSSESDEGGLPGTGLWYEGEWWPYDDDYEGNGNGTADGVGDDGGGGVYAEGD